MPHNIPAWRAREENVGERVLLWFWLIFSARAWMPLTSNWNFPTSFHLLALLFKKMCFAHVHWSGTRFNCRAHIARRHWVRSHPFFKKKKEKKKKDLTACGYDYVRMLSTKAPKWTEASFQSSLYYKIRTLQNIYVKLRGFLHSDTFILFKICGFDGKYLQMAYLSIALMIRSLWFVEV